MSAALLRQRLRLTWDLQNLQLPAGSLAVMVLRTKTCTLSPIILVCRFLISGITSGPFSLMGPFPLIHRTVTFLRLYIRNRKRRKANHCGLLPLPSVMILLEELNGILIRCLRIRLLWLRILFALLRIKNRKTAHSDGFPREHIYGRNLKEG